MALSPWCLPCERELGNKGMDNGNGGYLKGIIERIQPIKIRQNNYHMM